MKKIKGTKIVVGTLIPAVLLPSCSGYYWESDVITINQEVARTEAFNSVSIPINFNYDSEERKVMTFISKLIPDIIENPLIAKRFAEAPNSVAKAYGIDNINIDFDDEMWKLISALGDADLHEAIKTNNVSLFLEICDKKGLLSELQKSDILRYQKITIPESEIRPMCAAAAYVFFGVAAVLILAAAGCAGVNAAAVYNVETYWSGTESTRSAMVERDPLAYKLWAIKKGNENTYIMLSEYQEKMVNDCVDALNKYFPDKMENVDMDSLRQFISLNLPK